MITFNGWHRATRRGPIFFKNLKSAPRITIHLLVRKKKMKFFLQLQPLLLLLLLHAQTLLDSSRIGANAVLRSKALVQTHNNNKKKKTSSRSVSSSSTKQTCHLNGRRLKRDSRYYLVKTMIIDEVISKFNDAMVLTPTAPSFRSVFELAISSSFPNLVYLGMIIDR
jgi:hypothetical protein